MIGLANSLRGHCWLSLDDLRSCAELILILEACNLAGARHLYEILPSGPTSGVARCTTSGILQPRLREPTLRKVTALPILAVLAAHSRPQLRRRTLSIDSSSSTFPTSSFRKMTTPLGRGTAPIGASRVMRILWGSILRSLEGGYSACLVAQYAVWVLYALLGP